MGKHAEWIKGKSQIRRKCRVCLDPARPILSELLREIESEFPASLRISRTAIFDRMRETAKGFGDRITFSNFCAHMSYHEPEHKKARESSR